ncbi:MAG: hypothetical protein LUI07_01210 [Lachnospiraceae bacterium]|nr:hypothetical protein [Lachnospiraceae bacterium]
MSRKAEAYVIQNYGKKPTFASFLPGISGIRGIPLWCYYVNRGQCMVIFGAENKDKAIMEFFPAQDAYQNVKRTGFRTFLRVNGAFTEPFADEGRPHEMRIYKNSLEIAQTASGLRTEASYFTLPNEEIGALVRAVTVTFEGGDASSVGSVSTANMDVKKADAADTKATEPGKSAQAEDVIELELLDGMPAVVPYGLSIEMTKMMKELSVAWMESEVVDDGISCYRVRASMGDSAVVRAVEGANFSIGTTPDGTRVTAVADPQAVFAYDSSLGDPVVFANEGLDGVNARPQMRQNRFPCSFFGIKKTLHKGESLTLYEVIGQAEQMKELRAFGEKKLDAAYFTEKRETAIRLGEDLGAHMDCHTADPVFDEYCRYTFMDNALRGGVPVLLGGLEEPCDRKTPLSDDAPLANSDRKKNQKGAGAKVFYVYSRKHGDLERDYNYFSMMPEFYSQGNGNFRDVNQNRRCDPLFFPFVGDFNVRTFYSLLQPDGYNPLGVEKITYELDKAACPELFPEARSCADSPEKNSLPDSGETFTFTPGSLYRMLSKKESGENLERVLNRCIFLATPLVNGKFGEGYWTDHWTYNLDLIENYLRVFPEKEEELLYTPECTWFRPQAGVLERRKRYEKTEQGIRQYHSLVEVPLRNASADIPSEGRDGRPAKEERAVHPENDLLLCDDYGTGRVIHATIMEKLLMLCLTKFAALDVCGMGIEMEGGKPGWYDALNGLPGLLGSSVCELGELSRNLEYTIRSLKKYGRDVETLAELAEFFEAVHEIAHEEKEDLLAPGESISFWNRVNDAKEAYHAKLYSGVSGKKVSLKAENLVPALEEWLLLVNAGLRKATEAGDGICPSYFYYNVTAYEESEKGILPTHFEQVSLPRFLEGPVHALRLSSPEAEKKKLYGRIKESALYDKKLSMYKVNEPLAGSSFELGRCRAFTPGWLENESIWLHMEYKYLLELLKSGLYEEFFRDLHAAAIPFLNPEVYGRSTYENSSFLASSANPDPGVHGRGFVARLSGSTAEFIHMWTLMMFGEKPFDLDEKDGTLTLSLRPALPAWLIPEDGIVEARFLGNTIVRYHFPEQKDYLPGQYEIEKMNLMYDGSRSSCGSDDGAGIGYDTGVLPETAALDVREGKVQTIEVFFL